MKEIWKKGCSFLVSATLAVGLIPVPAFAQAAESISPSGGITAASPQENLKEVDQPLTQATQTSVQAAPLVAQSYNEDMVLGQSYDVSVEEGGFWVGKFTAPEAGIYGFASSGDYDTYGYLYADNSLEDQIAYDDDNGAGYNFLISWSLEAGQTVYLKANQISNHEANFTVSVSAIDASDLANATLSLDYWSVAYTGQAADFGVTVTDAAGNVLTAGADYQLVYWDVDYQKLSGAPTEVGSYYVSAVAVSGGAYKGETEKWGQVSVFDPYDLSITNAAWNGNNWLEYTGSPVVLPTSSIYYYNNTSDEDVYLNEGTDYKLSYYYKETDSQKKLTASDLVNPGGYYAVYEGIGQYHGTQKAWFRITGDANDMRFATVYLDDTLLSYTGEPVSFGYYDVYDTNGDEIDENAYTLVYYNAAGNKLSSAPVEPGDYSVAALAVSGSGYTGESTERTKFTIMGPNDLREGYNGWFDDNRVALNTAGITLPKVYIQRNSDDSNLVEGTDFRFAYFESEEGERLDGAPATVGSFRAVYAGIGSYEGSLGVWFDVCDPHDLSYAAVTLESTNVPLENGAAVLQVVVTDLAGNKLVEGADYVLKYVDENDYDDTSWAMATQTPPNKSGSYYVAAFPGSNKTYFDNSQGRIFEVYDPFDIGSSYWNARFWQGSGVVTDGSPVTLPMPMIYRWIDDDDEVRVRLVEGTDFELDHFESDEGENIGKVAPSKKGDYQAVYKGKGNGYHGTRSLYFTVYDAHDIGGGYWSSEFLHGDTYYTDGVPIALRPLVVYNYRDAAFLVEGTHFQFSHFENSWGERLDSAPSESGSYKAVYKGIAPYTGTISEYFNVRNSFSLSRASLTLSEETYPATGKVVEPNAKVRDSDGVLLAEGKDYQLTYFDDEENPIAAPSEKGFYYVAATAVDGGLYTGTSSRWGFRIGDSTPVTPIEPVKATLTLDSPATVTVKDNQYWVGTFKAPETGYYVFQSEGEEDSYGYLYSDENLTEEIYSDDDDGTGGNFRMTQRLEAGQTVYVKVRQYSHRAMTCTVVASKRNDKDLAYADFELDEYGLILQGATVAPVVTLVDVLGNNVAQSAYTLEYYYNGPNGYEKIVGNPDKAGRYYVCAVASKDGGYVGSTYNEYFTVYSSKDLAKATISLESREIAYTGKPVNAVASVTDAVGNVLEEGKDYELVYFGYAYDAYEMLASVPVEVGDYYVVARAKNGSGYTGQTRDNYFEVVDPMDIATNGSVSLQDYLYTKDLGYTSVPVYLYEGSDVTPSVTVRSYEDGVLTSANYTVSYQGNKAPTAEDQLATVTVTGLKPYSGSVTKKFAIAPTADLDSIMWYSGCQLTAGSSTSSYYADSGSKLQFVADGYPVTPTVSFADRASGFVPQQGTDFTVSYVDASGKAVAEPTEPGKYTAVLTATKTGKCSGEAKVPFVLVRPYELDYHKVYPTLTNAKSFSRNGVYYDGETNTITYDTNELATSVDAGSFLWSLVAGGKALVEGIDYTVTSVFDSVLNVFTYAFTGMGNYSGTVTGEVKVAGTAKQSFDSRAVSLNNTVRGVVYRNASGVLETPNVLVDGLVAGADYTFTGLVDANGKAVTSAAAGDTVYARIQGAGAYAGLVRTVEARVANGSSAVSLSDNNVFFMLNNGVAVNNDGAQWYLLNSAIPSVSLVVYKTPKLVMDEGNGFTVASTVNGSVLNLTLTATENSPVSGSTTKAVNLVPKYNLNSLISVVTVAGADSNEKIYSVPADGSAGEAVALSYAGVAFTPTVAFSTLRAGEPQIKETLKKAGAAVDAINGEGAYTLTLEGTGDWSGSITVPLQVTALAGSVDIAECTMTIGENTGLVSGQAKPTVTLTYGNYTLVENVDYTLEYGNNTAAGNNAWVKATATQTSKFRGEKSANFTVSGGEVSKTISKANGYELWLQSPSGDDFALADVVRTYPVGTKPAVQVKHRDANDALTTLDASNYTVAYSDVSKAGSATVTVTGKNGYEGSLSAEFFLASSVAKKEQVITAADKSVQVGNTVNLGATTNGDGKLSYRSSDESIATVNESGTVTGVKSGKATITIAASETKDYLPATKTVTVNVTAKPVQKVDQTITASNKAVKVGKTVALNATASGKGKLTYKSSKPAIATVNANGVVTGKAEGSTAITISAAATSTHKAATKTVTVTVSKLNNTLVTKKFTTTVQYSKVKKKNVAVASKVIKTKGKGKVTYALKSVTKKFKKFITVNAKNGKITVKKKAPKGKCTVTLTVKAAGNNAYKAATKKATVVITIK